MLTRYSLPADWAAKLRRALPGGDVDTLERLIKTDRVLTDDGKPHSALIMWIEAGLNEPRAAGVQASDKPT